MPQFSGDPRRGRVAAIGDDRDSFEGRNRRICDLAAEEHEIEALLLDELTHGLPEALNGHAAAEGRL
jgi:hypothetical protein